MSVPHLRMAIVAASLVGVGISGYLTYVHYAGIEPICAASQGCEKVQSSRYAELVGVPVALLGLIGYLAILATGLVRSDAARLAGSFLTLTGLGFSIYLTYLELFEIDAICQWCVASAVVMAALAVLTALRVASGDQEHPPTPHQPPRAA